MVSVKVQMTVTNNRLAIIAIIETWLLTDDKPSNQSTKEYEFIIEPDETIRLSFEGKQVTPTQAAEMVLMKALLGLPTERDNIAVLGKRSIAL